MTDEERELDLLVAELGSEIRMLITQNETLKQNLNAVTAERDRFKEALERILSVSRVALWDSRPQRVIEVGTQARTPECND
jgi:hypothetical protein